MKRNSAEDWSELLEDLSGICKRLIDLDLDLPVPHTMTDKLSREAWSSCHELRAIVKKELSDAVEFEKTHRECQGGGCFEWSHEDDDIWCPGEEAFFCASCYESPIEVAQRRLAS